MKISIITPSYNQGIFIDDAIQSVLAQDYTDFEHIIIDACSTDTTLTVLKKYPHLKWISEPDEGQSDAINKGFKMAKGEVIGWLNADDFYLPGTFRKVAFELKSETLDGIYANIDFCNKEGVVSGHLKSHLPVKFMSLFHCFIFSESLFFKRKIIDANNFIDKDVLITMDKKFAAQLLFKNYRLKHIKDSFAVFRRHEFNKSSSTTNVKLISDKEGIRMINSILNMNIPENQLTIKMYRLIIVALLPVRMILKLI